MSPKKILTRTRVIVLLLTVSGFGYLIWRFDLQTLPESRPSPLLRYEPGTRLLMDRHAPAIHLGDAVLLRDETGRLHLMTVARVQPEDATPDKVSAVWGEVDAPIEGLMDSDELGWIERSEIESRVVMVWPW